MNKLIIFLMFVGIMFFAINLRVTELLKKASDERYRIQTEQELPIISEEGGAGDIENE